MAIQTLELTNTYQGGNSSNRLFRDTVTRRLYVFQDGYWPSGRKPAGAASSSVQVDIVQTTGPDSDGVYVITFWSNVIVLYALDHLIPLVRDGYQIARVGWTAGRWIKSDGAGTIVDETETPTDIASADVLAHDWRVRDYYP